MSGTLAVLHLSTLDLNSTRIKQHCIYERPPENFLEQ